MCHGACAQPKQHVLPHRKLLGEHAIICQQCYYKGQTSCKHIFVPKGMLYSKLSYFHLILITATVERAQKTLNINRICFIPYVSACKPWGSQQDWWGMKMKSDLCSRAKTFENILNIFNLLIAITRKTATSSYTSYIYSSYKIYLELSWNNHRICHLIPLVSFSPLITTADQLPYPKKTSCAEDHDHNYTM